MVVNIEHVCYKTSFFRQKGVGGRYQGSELFQQRCYGSLHAVQRLELMYKLEAHRGCVNTLHFNSSGTLLASGSDDLSIVVWDWAVGKFLVSYDSGHRSNVFQVSFVLFADRLCSAAFIEYLLKYKNMGCRGEGNINPLVLPTE